MRLFVDFRSLLRRDVDNPQHVVLVEIGDPLRVWRPDRRVIEGPGSAEADLLHVAETGLVTEMKRVFAGFVGEVGDPLPVRRPGWISLGDTRSVGEVACVTLLRGHGKDLGACLERGARPGRRDGGVDDVAGDVDVSRPQHRHVGIDTHADGTRRTRRDVKHVQVAELLIDDRP